MAVFPPLAELEPGTVRSTGQRITYCATKAPLLHRKTKLVDFRTILVNILGAANFRMTILTAESLYASRPTSPGSEYCLNIEKILIRLHQASKFAEAVWFFFPEYDKLI